MKVALGFALAALLLSAAPDAAAEDDKTISLFNGQDFSGWEGNLDWFRVEDGAVVAGTLDTKIPRNEFLCTKEKFGDFELTLKVKVTPAKINAGIQFRSARIPNHHEVIGYQADVGGAWWGKLYDESRRRKVLTEIDAAALAKVLKPGDWNTYKIRCQGDRVQLWINGLQTVDYTEPNKSLPKSGVIGLQIHSGPPGEAWYKDLVLRKL